MGVRHAACSAGWDEDGSAPGRGRGGAVLEPDDVADAVIDGLAAERFLILPHPEVLEFFRRKATDYDRWLAGMRRLQARRSRRADPRGPENVVPSARGRRSHTRAVHLRGRTSHERSRLIGALPAPPPGPGARAGQCAGRLVGLAVGQPVAQGNPRSISFAGLDGYAAGDFGTLLHTTDGGATWSRLLSGTFSNLTEVQAIDAQSARRARGAALG